MKEIKINKIDSIFDAIDYFNSIIKIVDKEVKIDFSSATFIRNNFLSIIGMSIEILKVRQISIHFIKPKDIKVFNSMIRIGFLPKYSNENTKKNKYKTMVQYTKIPLTNNSLL